MPACQLLSVIGGRDTFLLFKDPAEIERVIVANDRGNFCDIIVCAFQKTDRVVDPDRKNILHGRLCGYFLEFLQEIADAHISGKCVFFNVDILVVMLLEISSGDSHLFLQVGTDNGSLVQTTAMNQKKNLFQIHGQ